MEKNEDNIERIWNKNEKEKEKENENEKGNEN